MSPAGRPDCLHVVNGPEDGAEFFLVRAPAHVGSDPSCSVHLTLDAGIRPKHVLLTTVSDGYRVRRIASGSVRVDNKPVGRLRSCVVRSGGYLQVGRTLLCLECAPDGLANRSHGIVAESDFGWVAQQAVCAGGRGLQSLAGFAFRLIRRLFGSWLSILSLIILVCVFSDTVRGWIKYLFWFIFAAIRNAVLDAFQ